MADGDRIEALIADAAALIPSTGRAILGLAGPPGAGKSTLAVRLVEGVNAVHGARTAAYVPLDGFHLSNAQLERLGHSRRKGAIFTFDVWGYVALLRRLVDGVSHPIYVPDYDRELHEPVAARHVVEHDTGLVITEGNYLAVAVPGWREIVEITSQLWYVNAEAELRERRLLRRHREGGRSMAHARWRVDGNDMINAELVAGGAAVCDRVVTVPADDGDA